MEELLPLADKKTKLAKTRGQERAIFRLFSFGLVTNRDDWMYGRDAEAVRKQVQHLATEYEAERETMRHVAKLDRDTTNLLSSIKWTRSVKKALVNGVKFDVTNADVVLCAYRPFDRQFLFYYPPLIEMLNQTRAMFGQQLRNSNQLIAVTDPTSQKPFMVLASDTPVDMHLVGAASGASCMPRFRFDDADSATDNITDWALAKFTNHYGKAAKITKDDIFHYVYGVLHDPVYRTTYAQNLKRELPRVPLYPDFRQWAGWGKRLMDLHIGYEGVDPWAVARTDTPDTKASTAGVSPKVILKSDPDSGTITLDSETVISGIPKEAWDYRLGNRSGLDWILDQHKEKTPKDPTIREKFNTYRFADHREKVAD